MRLQRHDFAVAGDDVERLEIVDERRCGEAAAVNVRGDGAADGEAIRAGLLLADAPRRDRGVRADQVAADDVRPGDAGLDLAAARVASSRLTRAIEPPHVEQSAPARNCCPPMAWRPPEMASASPRLRAWRTAWTTSSTERGSIVRAMRVRFSAEWVSLTSMARPRIRTQRPWATRRVEVADCNTAGIESLDARERHEHFAALVAQRLLVRRAHARDLRGR